MIATMRTGLFCAAILVAASGCDTMPWVSYGEPPPECLGFDPDRELEWAGHGTPPEFGLWPAEENLDWETGDIYVGVVIRPPVRMWCHVPEGGGATNWGDVPQDWTRP